VTVVLPWGSLLAAVAGPSVSLLRNIRALCQPEARLTVVLGLDPDRDRSEIRRLGLPPTLDGDLSSHLAPGYRAARFVIIRATPLEPAELARWPSTWARRLAHGRPRVFHEIEARAVHAH
jgi:hypothetical protein